MKRLIAELIVILAVYWMFFRHPDIRKDLPRVGRLRSWTVVALFAIAAAVQVTTVNQYDFPQRNEKFPFTRWAMFSGFTTSRELARIYEFEGLLADGRSAYLNPARLFKTPNAVVLFTKTNRIGSLMTSDNVADRTLGHELLQPFIRGLRKRYEGETGQSLRAIRFWVRMPVLRDGEEVREPFAAPQSEIIATIDFSCSTRQPRPDTLPSLASWCSGSCWSIS